LLPRALLVSKPIQRKFVVAVPGGKGYRYISSEPDRTGRLVFWLRFPQYEPETLPLFARIASQCTTFLDVGANTGIYTLTACSVNPRVRVTAIEAVPSVANRLRMNIDANGWHDRCRIVSAAASDADGLIELAVPRRELPTTSRLASLSSAPDMDTTSVPAITIDRVMSGHPAVDLVKIDVEGAEDKVLAGMTSALEHDRPIIFTEALTFESDHLPRVTQLLSAADYRFWRLSRDGVREQPEIVADPTRVERNYLCVPREKVDDVRGIVR
jgi:FkbM family methyltransferase